MASADVANGPRATEASALFAGYHTFYHSHAFSDLTPVCGERRWKVHKLVMSANCEWFMRACAGEFQESQTNTIELKEDDPYAVAAMVYYLYHGTYDATASKAPDTPTHAFDLNVLVVGDKYGVRGLAALAKDRLFDFLAASWRTDAFADMVATVCSADLPDQDVRKKVLRVARANRAELFGLDADNAFRRFREVAAATPAFMLDLMRMSAVACQTPSTTRDKRLATREELGENVLALRTMLGELDEGNAGFVAAQAQLESALCSHATKMAKAVP